MFPADANSTVTDFDADLRALTPCADQYAATFWGIADGIGRQIAEHPFKQAWVGTEIDPCLLHAESQLVSGGLAVKG